MTDYFALLQKERRPWLDPEELKEKYFALSRLARAGCAIERSLSSLK